MMKNTQLKIRQLLVFRAILITSLFSILSCRSEENTLGEGNLNSSYNVKVNLVGGEFEEEPPIKSASIIPIKPSNSIINSQKTTVLIDNDSYITATLVPEYSSLKLSATASINPIAGTPVRKQLKPNTKFKVVVFDNNGGYVTEKDFIYGQNNSGFQLDGDKTYTFIAYSLNTDSVPAINSGTALSTAKLSGVNGDLMYFKKSMTVSGNGINNLDVILKHQFSQITTKIDARQVGKVTGVTLAGISPANTSADISFATNSLTYNGSISGGAPVNFPILNNEISVSDSTQVISNTTTTGELNIGTLTIDGLSKNNIKVSNLKITPGVKYNLNLRLGPCRQDVNPVPFSVQNGTTQTFTMPATDFGFIFDIYTLDNSFNLNINGVMLATQEINFQGYLQTRTVRFKDGTTYGYETGDLTPPTPLPAGRTYDIWSLQGTPSAPLVRVVIAKDGTVTIFGSKTSGGPLEPLELYNGNSFNKITWNTSGSNTVIASQQVHEATNMSGAGTGKQITTCVN
ncbi:hypothetical protein HZQ57_15245 [Elizabethkingia anophelis]|nr:hypothetical protein [Elizabethkingia anophelis]MCT3813756.1 hypothetical protein [Elizabethkingia anophelis]MCT3820850.1 hypothetical protein [Elizabethkingia anophelis]